MAELARLRSENAELIGRLQEAAIASQTDRASRRAALNLVEDAVAVREQLLRNNAELQQRVAERQRAETALRDSELQLRSTIADLQTLNAAFDQRVQERTRELRDREARLRALTLRLNEVEQSQRHALAQLLHDHVQQFLIAAKMRVEFTADEVDKPQRHELQQVVAIINEAIQATRDLSVQLTPPLLHDQGLPPALDWLVARMSHQHGLLIEAKIDENANPPPGEARQILFQAAQELLFNVVKHAQTKQVELRLLRSRGDIRLSVTDNGAGFDTSREEDSRGSFGLFHLRQRLEAIGGSLRVRTSPGGGTRATAVLPSAAAGSRSIEAAPTTTSRATAPKTCAITVVLVDDHPIVREGLSQMLAREVDIQVVGQAGNGEEGIEVVNETFPQVVVMDVNMPVLNGIEATRRIHDRWPQTKIIGLSFEQTDEMNGVMLAAGAVKYLTKDAAASSLVQAIREVAHLDG